MSDTDQISWRAIIYGSPVLANDGSTVGTVHEVLGSDSEDIFHGIRVARRGQHDVMLPAEDVSSITGSAVTSDLTAAQIKSLAPFDDKASYHLASVGWLRKHVGWKRDSQSDEEPG